MTRDELVAAAMTGEAVERLIDDPLVQAALDDHLAARREAILALGPDEPERFVRLRAGLEAVEEFLAGLRNLVELGRQAGLRLSESGPNPEDRSRVL
jgi:hypothetical protein